MPTRTLLILLIGLAALAGCGRRGDLEAPDVIPLPQGSVAPVPTDPVPVPGEGTGLDTQSAGSQVAGETRPVGAPEKPFILDGLL